MRRLISSVAVSIVLGGFTGAAAQLPVPRCEEWNTEEFFRTATVDDVTACLAAGADLEARTERRPHSPSGRTPLHHAAVFSENPAVVGALITAGADVSAQTSDGFTPLFYANAVGVEVLLAAGADVNARMGGSTTPLGYVIGKSDSAAVVELLLAAGADFSNTFLHAAAKGEEPALVELLLAAGTDINVRKNDGETPLHEAATWSGGAHRWSRRCWRSACSRSR